MRLKSNKLPPAAEVPTYPSVPRSTTATLSRNEVRRPRVSASTPVGISKRAMLPVNTALATNTPKMSSPASRRKRVLTPQISDAESVYSPAMTR